MTQHETQPSPWFRRILIAAAIYNLVWGCWIIFAPLAPFEFLEIQPPLYPSILQCLGMVVGVYGVGYAIAAFDPLRHCPIVFVGLLGKTFGPIGFLWVALQGELPWLAGLTLLTNDLIWWIPFGWILWQARCAARATNGVV